MLEIIKTDPFLLGAIIIGFLISLAVHESAHAYVAYKLGDTTAKDMGRLTLNPLAHLDPFGTIALFVFGFGWGKPVPYNPARLRGKFDELKIALSGPFSNLVLAFIFALPYRYAVLQNIPIANNPWLSITNEMANLNILLVALNILPIPPLDGSKIIMLFLSPIDKIKFTLYGQWILFAIIIFQIISNFNILQILMHPIVVLLSILVKGVPLGF